MTYYKLFGGMNNFLYDIVGILNVVSSVPKKYNSHTILNSLLKKGKPFFPSILNLLSKFLNIFELVIFFGSS